MQQATEQLSADGTPRGTDEILVLVALGANLPSPFGPPERSVRLAFDRIEAAFGGVTGKSLLYRTPCFPTGSGPDYVNAAFSLKLPARGAPAPHEVLKTLHEIEADFRRERAVRWGARTLDLDLLAVGSVVLPDAATQATWRNLTADAQARAVPGTLILPHPRMQDRAFVLVPLADVAPDWRHPLTHVTVRQMCDALPAADRAAAVPLDAAPKGS